MKKIIENKNVIEKEERIPTITRYTKEQEKTYKYYENKKEEVEELYINTIVFATTGILCFSVMFITVLIALIISLPNML